MRGGQYGIFARAASSSVCEATEKRRLGANWAGWNDRAELRGMSDVGPLETSTSAPIGMIVCESCEGRAKEDGGETETVPGAVRAPDESCCPTVFSAVSEYITVPAFIAVA